MERKLPTCLDFWSATLQYLHPLNFIFKNDLFLMTVFFLPTSPIEFQFKALTEVYVANCGILKHRLQASYGASSVCFKLSFQYFPN